MPHTSQQEATLQVIHLTLFTLRYTEAKVHERHHPDPWSRPMCKWMLNRSPHVLDGVAVKRNISRGLAGNIGAVTELQDRTSHRHHLHLEYSRVLHLPFDRSLELFLIVNTVWVTRKGFVDLSLFNKALVNKEEEDTAATKAAAAAASRARSPQRVLLHTTGDYKASEDHICV